MKKTDGNASIQRFVSRTGQNQYLLASGGEAAAIDVSEAADEVGSFLDKSGTELKYLLITHAHESHLRALPDLKNKYGGTFCLHEYEYELYRESAMTLEPEQELKDEQKLPLGDVEIEVILTAGHTKGSVS